MKKIILWILGIIYLTVSIITTSYLLHYNDYNLAVYGNKTYVSVTEKLEDFYAKDSLLAVKKEIANIKVGDELLYYDTFNTTMKVMHSKVEDVTKVTDDEYSYTIDTGNDISSEYILGGSNQTKEYKKFGSIMNFLTSKWGYLFVIVLPVLVIFIYELYVLIKELVPKKKKVTKAVNEKEEE